MEAVSSWNDYLGGQAEKAGIERSQWHQFREQFFRGRTRSIDRFVQYYQKEWGELGRACVAAILLNCERESWLDKDWYEELLDQIAPSSSRLKAGDVSVVTFNYDRSFEHYFRSAFAAQFNLPREAALKMFECIDIEHVYGDLGPLDEVGYGDIGAVKKAAAHIDFMRDHAENSKRDRINEKIAAAGNLCFLGFSFAPENVALFDRDILRSKKLVFATTLGLSQSRMSEMKKMIPLIKFYDMTALELLRQENVFRAALKAKAEPEIQTRAFAPSWVTRGLPKPQVWE